MCHPAHSSQNDSSQNYNHYATYTVRPQPEIKPPAASTDVGQASSCQCNKLLCEKLQASYYLLASVDI